MAAQKYPRASLAAWYQSRYLGNLMNANTGVVHTTEGTALPSYGGGGSAPTFTLVPSLKDKTVSVYQHFDVDRSARALVNKAGGVQTNTLNCVQVELTGTCDPKTRAKWIAEGRAHVFWPEAPDWALMEFARLVRWLSDEHGVKLASTVTWKAYPGSYGANGVRLSGQQWMDYYGWCFTGDMLVTTRRGQVPLNEILVGDQVLTHKGRFRPVTALHERTAQTGVLIGQGHPGLRTTAEHPFLSASSQLQRRTAKDDPSRARHLVYSEPEWTEAENMEGRYWATPTAFPAADVPEVTPLRGKGRRSAVTMSPELLQLAGRYVADGHLGSGGKIIISAAPSEEPEVVSLCRKAGFETTTITHRNRGALQIAAHSVSFSAWLLKHFNQHAHAKSIPTWLLGAPEEYRHAFLSGYLDGDGHWEPCERFDAKTVSKSLAIGVRLLASSLGYSVSMYLVPERVEVFPNGNTSRSREQWRVKGSRKFGRGTATKVIGDHRYSRVKSWDLHGEPTKVFNISVDEDESYVVDGIVVHNCGHQHVPENDHGDPGNFPMAKVLSMAREKPWEGTPPAPKPPTVEERLTALEKTVKDQGARLAVLETKGA